MKKKKEIQKKIVSILEQYIIKAYVDDRTIDVPFVQGAEEKEFITNKQIGENIDLEEDYLVDEPEKSGYEEGNLDGEVPDEKNPPYEEGELDGEIDDEDEPENYEEIEDEDLHQQRRAADGPDVEAGNPAHSHPAGSAGQSRHGAQHQADCATDEREPQGGAGAIREGLGVGANGLGKEREHLAQERQGQHHEHQRGDKGGIAALLAGPGLRPEGDKHE